MSPDIVQVRARDLPARAAWAEGLPARVPPELAPRFDDPAETWEGEPAKRAARDAAGYLRLCAAFTEAPPASARLPINYRTVPGPLRRFLARGLGRWHRARESRWSRYPGWPLDLSTDLAADLAGDAQVTFERTPVLLTHDIDSAEGLDNLVRWFLPAEEAVGAHSANYVVPCAWPLDHGLIAESAQRGHEIGVHGYDHANRTPFASPEERRDRLQAGRKFGDRYAAIGYRAPSLLRTRSLLADLAGLYAYDASIPTSGGAFPVPNNGCASARPWRIGALWEIPLTLPRDGSLRFLGYDTKTIGRIWRDAATTIARSGGLVSLLTHCEAGFSGNPAMLAAYRDFIAWLAAEGRFQFARPCDLVRRLGTAR